MNTYEFELTFSLPRKSDDPEKYLEALKDKCDDAVCGIGKIGQISLLFTRESKNGGSAISSAYKDVMAAIPGSGLLKVGE